MDDVRVARRGAGRPRKGAEHRKSSIVDPAVARALEAKVAMERIETVRAGIEDVPSRVGL
jgi:hypothetical protein